MDQHKAADFSGNTRIHVGLGVRNLEDSKAFYQALLGVKASKERPGYVKFEPENPSLNLTLNQVGASTQRKDSTTHYGVQVKSSHAVQEARVRLEGSGIETLVEEGSTCCYAVQGKVWATDPDGNRWEVFVVLNADADQRIDSTSQCCAVESDHPSRAAACC